MAAAAAVAGETRPCYGAADSRVRTPRTRPPAYPSRGPVIRVPPSHGESLHLSRLGQAWGGRPGLRRVTTPACAAYRRGVCCIQARRVLHTGKACAAYRRARHAPPVCPAMAPITSPTCLLSRPRRVPGHVTTGNVTRHALERTRCARLEGSRPLLSVTAAMSLVHMHYALFRRLAPVRPL